MLVVLSEMNCLTTLQAKHVYPNQFYTDFEEFKHRAVFFKDATILVIFGGNCRFNKRITLEFVKTLIQRSEEEADSGIKKVYIISDMTLAGIRSYYKYTGNINLVDIMHGWKSAKQGVDIWKKLKTDKVQPQVFLSAFDSGDVSELLAHYKEEINVHDEYAAVIQVPDLRKLLAERAQAIKPQ